jgi:dolichyl-phosphate-mannose-protein mannosyltransferase
LHKGNNMLKIKFPLKANTLFLLCLLFFVSFVFRLISIGQESFFIDEVLTLRACTEGVWQHVTKVEVNPPLYFYLIKIWSLVFGTGHIALRLFSAFAGSFAPVLIFLTMRSIGAKKYASFLCALLLAISPLALWYGQQARCYSLLMTISSLWIYLIMESPDKGAGWRRKFFLTLCTFAGISTHYYFILILGGVFTVLLPYIVIKREKNLLYRTFMPLLIGGVTGLLYIPLIITQSSRDTINWTPRPTWDNLTEVFFRVFPSGSFSQTGTGIQILIRAFYILAALVVIISIAIPLSRLHKSNPSRRKAISFPLLILASCVLFSTVLPWLLSLGEHSIFLPDRYTIIALPAFISLLFLLPYGLKNKRVILVSQTCIFIIWASLAIRSDISYWKKYQDFDWRGSIRIIEKEANRNNDLILFLPGWMESTFCTNGGDFPNILRPENISAPKLPEQKRIWIFYWEGNPDIKQKEFIRKLEKRKNVRIRVSFPHIKLLEAARDVEILNRNP